MQTIKINRSCLNSYKNFKKLFLNPIFIIIVEYFDTAVIRPLFYLNIPLQTSVFYMIVYRKQVVYHCFQKSTYSSVS
jgi:hypothetical protein